MRRHIHRSSRNAVSFIVLVVLCVVAASIFGLLNRQPSPEPSPERALQAAWRAAEASRSFGFSTEIEQTTYPALSLANVGRSSKTDTLRVEGRINRADQSMHMRLSNAATANGADALEIRVRDGVAEGRVQGGDWQKVDNVADVFAPAGDMMTFIKAAANVSRTTALPGMAAPGFTFDINGNVLADTVRDQLVSQMSARGELPPGVSLDAPTLFRGATGASQMWLNDAGYPARMSVEMALPEQRNGERVTVKLNSRFSDFKGGPEMARRIDTLDGKLQAAGDALRSPDGARALNIAWLALAFGALMAGAIALARRSKRARQSMIILLVASVTIAPLLQSQQVYAFTEKQYAQAAEQKSAAADEAAAAKLKAELSANTWKPNSDPLAAPVEAVAPVAVVAAPAGLPYERLAAAPAAQSVPAADDKSDADADGLIALQEARLGTDPASSDTDGDQIPDKSEVGAFSVGGRSWYLDPTAADSNGDTLLDTVECPDRIGNAAATCPDTDGDGTPDVFDRDNDNDGVPDTMDASPMRVMGSNGTVVNTAVFSDTNPFFFAIQNLQRPGASGPGYQTFVDFQIRPSNPAFLLQANNVFDWPNGDIAGQIQRVMTDSNGITNTTFATYFPNGDAKNSNGDVRLVPMLEIRMDGAKLPLKLTTPSSAQSFEGNGITGTLAITGSGSGSRVQMTFSSAGTYTATLASGTCLSNTATQTQTVTNGGSFTTAHSVISLANGQRVLKLVNTSAPATNLCVSLADIPNGALSDRMIDTDYLSAYGVSARDVSNNGLATYVPLSAVSDPGSGDRVAFGARMPYWPEDPNNWGNNHSVRLIWLVTLLNDGATSIVHTYADDWRLTGLSVREDRGVSVAVAFEDPIHDADPNRNDRLLALALGLEKSFLAGRDSDGNNQRDITTASIRARFDNTVNSGVSLPDSWNIKQNALRVATFAYDNSDELAKVAMTETTRLLNTHFLNAGQPRALAPLMLYARETRFRQFDLEDAAATSNGLITFNLDPALVTPQNVASVNWSPYRYLDGKWQNYPVAEYASKLNADFQKFFAGQSEIERTADTLLMQGLHMALLSGSSASLQSTGGTPQAAENAAPDSAIAATTSTLVGSSAAISKDFLEPLAGAAFESAIDVATNRSLLKTMPFSAVDPLARGALAKTAIADSFKKVGGEWADAFSLKRTNKRTGLVKVSGKAAGAFLVGAIALTVTFAVLGAKDGGAPLAIAGAMSSVQIIMAAKELYTAIQGLRGTATATVAVGKAATKLSRLAKILPAAGMILEIGVAWGMAIAQLAMDRVAFGSAKFFNIVAEAIAATVVAVIMFAIAVIPVIGQLIAAVIAAIDAVIAGICFGLDRAGVKSKNVAFSSGDVGKRFCKGLSGLVAEFIKNFLYSRRSLVGNMASPERLNFLNAADIFSLVDPASGIVKGANATVKIDLSNKIIRNTMTRSGAEINDAILPFPFDPLALPYLWQYNNDNLKGATFNYELQPDKKDIHGPLERGQMSGQWQPVAGTDNTFVYYTTVQTTSRGLLGTTGINSKIHLGLVEGQAVPAQQCFGIPTPPFGMPLIPVCTIVADKNTNFIPLDDSLVYDILPATLGEFIATTPTRISGSQVDGGVTLAWAAMGGMTFKRQKDADGDGLRNTADGGNDPNDALWDTDNDGLSDSAEIKVGADPQLADTDSDTLLDAAEIAAGTNPRLADSDADGLTDRQEIDGWEFVYDITSSGQQKTWVTSDPLKFDSDGDNISDALEKTYGFNPNVRSELKVLTYQAQVNELAAPRFLWRFDEAAGARAFADASGFNASGACASTGSCPTSGVASVYGNAASFDGDDTIRITPPFTLANSSFTVAMWAKRATPNANHVAFSAGTLGVNTGLYLGFRSSNTFTCDFAYNNLDTGHYVDTDWHHWACTYDAATRLRRIYRDGVQVAQDTSSSNFIGAGDWTVGAVAWGGTTFSGALDDVAVFQRALTAAEVATIRDGRFNPSDLIVKPSDTIAYSGTVRNELLNRYANGLFSAQMPGGVSGNVPPQSFVLEPQQARALNGTLTVGASAASGVVSFTQGVEASIQDRREQSGYAEAWLKFDDGAGATTFTDFSGNIPPRNATCSGVSCPAAGQPGVAGNAPQFDGIDDSLAVSPGTIAGNFTVAAWVRPDHATNAIAFMGSRGGNDFSFDLKFQNGNTIHADIGTGAGWLTTAADASFNYTVGRWYHVAYVVTTGGWTAYVDGVQRGSGTYNGTPLLADAQHQLRIGNNGGYPGVPESWQGGIDDVRVFNRALSNSDISALAALPVLRLSFDGNTTFRAADSSGARNDAACTGGRCPTLTGGTVGNGVQFRVAGDGRTDDDWYSIASNPSLNFNDGNVTLSTWINPSDTGDSAYDAYPQGLIGRNSGDANSTVALQRVGKKLRFGFGDASGWQSATTISDVLAIGQWQQVGATFDGVTVRFFVNGREVGNSNALSGKRPSATDFGLLIGRSDNNWLVDFGHVNVEDEGEADSNDAEGVVKLPDYQNWCRTDTSWDTGDNSDLNWAPIAWQVGWRVQMWEDDSVNTEDCIFDSGDDWLLERAFYGTDMNGDNSQVGSNDTRAKLHWRIAMMDAVAFAGAMDEVAAFKRAFSADEMLAQYDATRGGQLLRLDEPPGSTEFRDATGSYKLTCAGASCPTAGVAGRIAQGLQFTPGQNLSAPWAGGNQEHAVSMWFKTTNRSRILFQIGYDRRIWIDAYGNINASVDSGEPALRALKNATQSSNYGDGHAERLIDGNLDTINHTNIGPNEWWQADLALGMRKISVVRVFNRFDCCQDRLHSFKTILYNSDGIEVWRSASIGANGTVNPITVDVPDIKASRVRIQLDGSNYLNLAEVEVEADPLTLFAATQSSIYESQKAKLSTDGNLLTWNGTNGGTGNWWQANIDGANPLVSAIRIYNRRDCCHERLSPFNVVLYNADGVEVWRRDMITHDKGNNALIIPVPNVRAKTIKIEHKRDDFLHMAEVRLETRVSAPVSMGTNGVNYADGQWHHLLYTMGGSPTDDFLSWLLGSHKIYVDGEQRAVQRDFRGSIDSSGQVMLGYPDSALGFEGFMDQVRLFSRAAPSDGLARTLFADVPNAAFKLDEPAGSNTFANAANSGNAGCYNNACPSAGVNGKVGLAAEFNGAQGINIGNTLPTQPSGPFAFSLWFNPKTWSTGHSSLLWKHNNYDLYREGNNLKLVMVGLNPNSVSIPLPSASQWHQIVANYTGGSLQLYLNGSLAASVTANGSPAVNGESLVLGHEFTGQLDEFAIYNRYLSAFEIRANYLYQQSLVAERRSFNITIDNDAPNTVRLRSNTAFVPNRDRVMDIQATDRTSSISLVEFGSQKQGEGALQWTGAPVCRDAIDNNAGGATAFCALFRPRGEGRYTLRQRAADAVGNQANSSTDTTIYVDGTPPNMTLTAPPALVKPAKLPNGGWFIALAGAVSDPQLPGGFAGSGVISNSLMIRLTDGNGAVLGSAQRAELQSNGAWSVNYVVNDSEPLGRYTVNLEAEDAVGNAAAAALGTVALDTALPVLTINPQSVITATNATSVLAIPAVFTTATVLSGTVGELGVPGDAAVYLPFEEITRSAGYVGRALSIGGAGDVVAVPVAAPISDTFSVAAWVKPSHTGVMAVFGSRAPAEFSFDLKLMNANTIRVDIGDGSVWLAAPADVSFNYPVGGWTHLALVAEPTGYSLYVNGERAKTGAFRGRPLLADATHLLRIGSNGSGEVFGGQIDEAAVFRRALTPSEIKRMAQASVLGVQSVEAAFTQADLTAASALPDHLIHIPFDEPPATDGSTNFKNIAGIGNTFCWGGCPSAGMPGKNGTAARFDGYDYIFYQGQSAIRDRFTVAAWLQPETTSGSLAVIGGYGQLQMHLQSGNAIRVSGGWSQGDSVTPFAYDAGRWMHLAIVVENTPKRYMVYANGALIKTVFYTGTAALQNDDYGYFFLGDDSSWVGNWLGAMDDFRVFSAALSAAEIQNLYRSNAPVLKLDFDTDIADSTSWKQSVVPSALSQMPLLQSSDARAGSGSALFDGVDDRVVISPSLTLANNSFTVAAWAKRASSGREEYLFTSGRDWDANNSLHIGFRPWNAFTCSFWANDLDTIPQYTDTDWHHWMCTYDAATRLRTIYRDGVQVAQNTASINLGGNAPWIVGGASWGNVQFNGAIDDLRVYPYALTSREANTLAQTGFRPATLSGAGAGSKLAQWSLTPPAGLEGLYTLSFNTKEANAPSGALSASGPRWTGIVDTLAPRVVAVTQTGNQFRLRVRDFNIDPDRFVASRTCSNTGTNKPAKIGADNTTTPDWYRSANGATTLVEAELLCDSGSSLPLSLTSCDVLGNCATYSTNSPVQSFRARKSIGEDALSAAILSPADAAVLTNTNPVSISGLAGSPTALDALTVTVNNTVIYTQAFAPGIFNTSFAASWTPGGQGVYVAQAEVRSGAQLTVSAPVTFSVDTEAPKASFDAPVHPSSWAYGSGTPVRVITQTYYADPLVLFNGLVTDTSEIAGVSVEIAGDAFAGIVKDGRWQVGVLPNDSLAIDGSGGAVPVTITLTDRGGLATTLVERVVIDTVAGRVNVNWHGSSGFDFAAPEQGGIAGYHFGFLKTPTYTLDGLQFWAYNPSDFQVLLALPPIAWLQADDGAVYYSYVVVRDNVGNLDAYEGPIEYADNPRTPDYLGMNEPRGPYQGKPYRGWMDNGCSYLGQDTRIPRAAQKNAALNSAQKLYATWNHDALRVTWSGADWSRDGDLFVYLDTIPDASVRHGSNVAHNPYTSTNPSTLMLLPVTEWSNVPVALPPGTPDLKRMNADLALWVENNTTVHLMRWNETNNAWAEEAWPANAVFNFDSESDSLLTEFYLPFVLLGVTVGNTIGMVAFASDDDALRVWSALPAVNPASSARVTDRAVPAGQPFKFMLTDRYQMTLSDNSCRAPAYQTTLGLASEPGGLTYASRDDALRMIVPRFSFFANAYTKVFDGYFDIDDQLVSPLGVDHRNWTNNTFCPANPYDLACDGGTLPVSLDERVASRFDTKPATLLVGQRVTYTVHYRNEFTATTTYPLWMRGTAPGNDRTIAWDGQPWKFGCEGWLDVALPPASEGALVFTGTVLAPTAKVDIDFSPEARITDSSCDISATTPAEPYNRLTASYKLDTQGPSFASIDAPRGALAQGSTTLRGSVVDDSSVPTITVEFKIGAGSTQDATCVNPTPDASQWSCPIDIGSAPNATEVLARVRGIDVFGQAGAFGDWVAYTVDAQAPVFTSTVGIQANGGDALKITGGLLDNGALDSLDVCPAGESCASIDLDLDDSAISNTLHIYDDAPAEPITITTGVALPPGAASVVGSCSAVADRVVRTFSVPESFTVARALVGLNITHPYRSDLRATLLDPSGAAIELINFAQTVRAENFDLRLSDASDNAPNDERGVQDTGLPYYDVVRKPAQPLAALAGKAAQGVWTLVICDVNSGAELGAFNRAQLMLEAVVDQGASESDWSFSVPYTGTVDGEDKVFNLYGRDVLGNRSAAPAVVTVTLDNVPPKLTINQGGPVSAIAESQDVLVIDMTAPQIGELLSGTVSDGGGVQSVVVTIEDPAGQIDVEAVGIISGSNPLGRRGAAVEWNYGLRPRQTGRHRLVVTATDPNGNVNTSAPIMVDVAESPLGLALDVDIVNATPGTTRRFVASVERGTGLIYTWNLGDGTVITGTSNFVEHAYGALGAYTVTVNAANALGNALSAVSITVWDGPPAEPTPTPEPTPTATPSPTPDGQATPPPTPLTNTPRKSYLPWVMRGSSGGESGGAADLTIVSVNVSPAGSVQANAPATIEVVVRNQGGTAASNFWVELYVDPTNAPNVNDTWSALCNPPWPSATCYGGSWHVTQSLAPGESITLSSQVLVADTAYSRWPGYFASAGSHTLYALADSYAESGTQGVVAERDESNNRFGPVAVAVGANNALQQAIEPEAEPGVSPEIPPLQQR